MSMDLILSKAVEIGELMRETEQVKRLLAANEAFEADEALRDKVGNFEMQRQKLVQMQNDGASNEEMETQNSQIMSIYEEIMASPIMSDMTDANNEVQQIMNYIIRTISSCFAGSSDECGGDCSGCAGCH
ncbi:MAG: YlbF family regulator [Clostridia bacterium]|nr:YlbF family regulator [Clostridia bacterium]